MRRVNYLYTGVCNRRDKVKKNTASLITHLPFIGFPL